MRNRFRRVIYTFGSLLGPQRLVSVLILIEQYEYSPRHFGIGYFYHRPARFNTKLAIDRLNVRVNVDDSRIVGRTAITVEFSRRTPTIQNDRQQV